MHLGRCAQTKPIDGEEDVADEGGEGQHQKFLY